MPVEPRLFEIGDFVQAPSLIAGAFQDDPLFHYWCRKRGSRYRVQAHAMADILNGMQLPSLGSSLGVFDGDRLQGLAYLKDSVQLNTLRGLPTILWQVWSQCGTGAMLRFIRVGAELPRHWPSGHHLYLSLLAVSPPQQGLGLGRALLAASEDFARQRGYPSLCLDTQNPDNVAYYRSSGYQLRAQLEIGSLQSWCMEKRLD